MELAVNISPVVFIFVRDLWTVINKQNIMYRQ